MASRDATMDRQRGIKRPRSESASVSNGAGGAAKKPVAATGPMIRRGSKGGKSITGLQPDPPRHRASDGPDSTTNAEGQWMANTLNVLSSTEQSQFEAFRRSTFRGDEVSAFVARCLLEEEQRRHATREGTRRVLGGRGLGVATESRRTEAALRRSPYVVDGNCNPRCQSGDGEDSARSEEAVPHLRELVAPGASQEITVVVSTLAKSYAQRLVAAARRVASAECHPRDAPLLPRHLSEAHRHRVQAGIDPGFFLMPPEHAWPRPGHGGSGTVCGVGSVTSSAAVAALGIVNREKERWEAALSAQDAYDKRS